MPGLKLYHIEYSWVESSQQTANRMETKKVNQNLVVSILTNTMSVKYRIPNSLLMINILHFFVGWPVYAQLLVDLFKFLSSFLRNAELAKPVHRLYRK